MQGGPPTPTEILATNRHRLHFPPTIPRIHSHPIPEQLGANNAGSYSPHRRCVGQLVVAVPKYVLEASIGSNGAVLKGPDTSTPAKYPVRSDHSQSHHQSSHCFTNHDTTDGSSPMLERAKNNYLGTSSRRDDNQWDDDQLQVERCRSPRSFDVHHLPREHSLIPTTSYETFNSHSYRSAPASAVIPTLNRSDSKWEQLRRLLSNGSQPSDMGCSGDILRLSSPRCGMEEKGRSDYTGPNT